MSLLTRFTDRLLNREADQMATEIAERIADASQPHTLVKEIIGRYTVPGPYWSKRFPRTVDPTRPDYNFWDLFSNGLAPGFELVGGIFGRSTCQIISSEVLGTGIKAALSDTKAVLTDNEKYTNAELNKWLSRKQGLLLQTTEDLGRLGDQWAFQNMDGTLSVASPDTVEPVWEAGDYRKLKKVTVKTTTDEYEMSDEYRADGRTVRIKFLKAEKEGEPVPEPVEQNYANLIGKLPVVHLKWGATPQEQFGKALFAGAYWVMVRFNNLLNKAIDGAEATGNPVPVFFGMENIDETAQKNFGGTTDTFTDEEGNTRDRPQIDWDSDQVVFVGKGGDFKYAGPSVGWSSDTLNVLQFLFLMIMVYTRIAEYMWGGQISSGRASTQEQRIPFEKYIQYLRACLEGYADEDEDGVPTGGLRELIDLYLRTRRLTDPRIVVGPVSLQWPEISVPNEAIRFEWVKMAKAMGLIPNSLFLSLSKLGIEDPDKVLEAARIETQKNAAAAAAANPDTFTNRLNAATNAAAGGGGGGSINQTLKLPPADNQRAA